MLGAEANAEVSAGPAASAGASVIPSAAVTRRPTGTGVSARSEGGAQRRALEHGACFGQHS